MTSKFSTEVLVLGTEASAKIAQLVNSIRLTEKTMNATDRESAVYMLRSISFLIDRFMMSETFTEAKGQVMARCPELFES